ncbi:MAG: glycosyltransferase [bacterium]
MISVIVPHYNQPQKLRACLSALQQQHISQQVEIIVGDNMTPDGIDEIVRDFPDVIFVYEEERGAACARNKALKHAHGDIIAFTDSDCIPDQRWLAAIYQYMQDRQADLVGGDVRITYAQPTAPTAVEAFEKIFGFRQRLYITRKGFSVTANLVATRRLVEAVGPFYNDVSEDMNWCHRARALGYDLHFCSAGVVAHPARQNWQELTLKWQRLIKEHWCSALNRKRPNFVTYSLWFSQALLVVLSIVPHSVMLMGSRKINRFETKCSAWGILCRIRLWRACRMIKTFRTRFNNSKPYCDVKLYTGEIKGETR